MTETFTPPRILISNRAREQLKAFACSLDRILIGFAKVEDRNGGKELVVVEAYVFEQKAAATSSNVDYVALCRDLPSEMRCFWRTSPAGILPRFNEVDGQVAINLLQVWSHFISLVVDIFGKMEVKYDITFNGRHVTHLGSAKFVGKDLGAEEAVEIERVCQEQVLEKVTLVDYESADFVGEVS